MANRPMIASKRRDVYDNHNSDQIPPLPTDRVMTEKDHSYNDSAAQNVFKYSGIVWDFYSSILHRASIDDNNMTLKNVVHFSNNFANAFWESHVQMMFYGDGDPALITGFTEKLDVIGHELTHGVVDHTSPLDYVGQSGALNESIADVFGITILQWHNNDDINNADWLIGAGMIRGKPLRNMKNPESCNQPGHMAQFKSYPKDTAPDDDNDNLGVHTNSGIPNKAYYQFCKNLFDSKLSMYSWDIAIGIWYHSIADPDANLSTGCDFNTFAARTLKLATKAGVGKELKDAWFSVGIVAVTP